MTGSCDDTGYISPEGHPNARFYSMVRFSLEKTNGQMPDLSAMKGACTTPLAVLRIEKELETRSQSMQETCAGLDSGPQPLQSCAIRINNTLGDAVAEQMLNATECKSQTWPNVTGMLGPCPREKSGVDMTRVTGLLSSIVLFLMFISLPS